LLLELRVKDLGIIEDIHWKLSQGFNAITGETGAGKSLIIDAVEIMLSGSAGQETIRSGAAGSIIEGVFVLENNNGYSPLKALLAEKGLSQEEDLLSIEFELRRQKPAIVRINGHTVTKTVLRSIGEFLIDIHGQSQHLSLLNSRYHLDLLDAFAHTQELRHEFELKASELAALDSQINTLISREKDLARQEEFLQYQINEIREAHLKQGEDEDLEKERRLISLSEKLREYSSGVYTLLKDSDSDRLPVIGELNRALVSLKKLAEIDPDLSPQLETVEKAVFGLEEVAGEMLSYSEKLDHDPQRQEEIESRLEQIHNLKRKYGNTIPDILAFLTKTEQELADSGISSEKRENMEKQRSRIKLEMGRLASDISLKRSQAAKLLAQDVKRELEDLNMAEVEFEVAIRQLKSSITGTGILCPDGLEYSYTETGIDEVEFMVSTNPGEPLLPLSKIASTGEISRFTLALKSALSEADKTPVLIFDEIDIGVGGRNGETIGKKLWNLSQNHQVICVTHLPQIAAYAESHYCVRKLVNNDRTISRIDLLDEKTRIEELASMLAGSEYSRTAQKSAAELLQKSLVWRKRDRDSPAKPLQLELGAWD